MIHKIFIILIKKTSPAFLIIHVCIDNINVVSTERLKYNGYFYLAVESWLEHDIVSTYKLLETKGR